ncbi:peptidoglycan-binding protein [Streptomyces sp. ND04-05B]|uniref:peptidoglycan-binding protein n=1 Tax=Streptomyces sp. ND04-05B TaxID=3028693 RepID=UPI0029B7CB87|nr:peptidoglycan-binding protein [Streptomyces sp. ND04-05B]MDX3067869.1 peptidoglycan-binding protein [Streptomyces sp. ND04-05B]
MAAPLSAAAFLAALRAEGVRVVETSGWRTRNRNSKGAWGPVHGVMIHHTVTKGTATTVALCRDGHSALPGPLCHGVITKDGTVHLVGYGRTNHAGLGDGDVLAAVIAERPLPADNQANTDGNRHFYGFECENLGDGQDPWPAAQLEAIEKAAAAICRLHDWDQRSVIGHLEWQPGKVDPRGFGMDWMRGRIGTRLAGTPAPPPKPKPPARKHEPFPGAAFFRTGRRSAVITAMGKRLVAEGCGRYRVGPGPAWSEADRQSYAAWQRKLGYSGSAADGIPGKTSWDKLRVPTS